jgi:hypothetical protein
MRKFFVLLVLIVAALLLTSSSVLADEGEMFNWKDPCGYTCYQWADGSGDCYPCLDGDDCGVIIVDPTPEPQPNPDPDPDPDPEPKVHCNRGPGNGEEGCDPGNSGGKPGNAGEDNEG